MIYAFEIEGVIFRTGADVLWVGLTGGIACGKSTVAQIFRSRGYAVIDADQLAREVVQIGAPAYAEIRQAFGPDAVLPEGGLNRKRIAELVFSQNGDRTKLDLLESLTHPRVRELTALRRDELRAAGTLMAFYDVPLLYEKKMQSNFDRVIVIACKPETQLRRLMERDSLGQAAAEARIRSQLPLADKVALADEVIHNEGSLPDLEREINGVIGRLLLVTPKA